MCGIAGIIGFEQRDRFQERDEMLRMLGMIRHRGPDQFGIYQDAVATLGSARLSIIDISSGQQPIGNEDGTLWIVFNGEIFNYVELRPDLEKKGHCFRTSTDTEVLLHCYEEYGPDCVSRLNGEFAFAIWNSRTGTLFLARDRLGVRPLFYCEANGSLLFASEAKALLAHSGVVGEIDPVTLTQIFVNWAPLPGRSIFRRISELPPAHYMLRDRDSVRRRRYWDLSFPPETCTQQQPDSLEGYLQQFETLLVDAAVIRLRSDVPVGAYLSGGLDSSLLAAIIATRTRNPLRTFSVTFADPEFDESAYQMRVSRFLGTAHELVHITYSDIARVFPDVIWHTEAPITRTAPAPLFLLSKAVHNAGFKVVITGEGADEFLAGYDIFKEVAIRRFWARQPASTRRPALFRRVYNDIPRLAAAGPSFVNAFFELGLTEVHSPYYSHLVRWRNNRRTTRFFSEAVIHAMDREQALEPELPAAFATWGSLQRAQYLEAAIFLSQYLLSAQGDRMAMAHSVESRLPFLDYRVVEFCNRLPTNLKLRGLKDKYLLRSFARGFLPPEVSQRPKRPYRAPIQRSFLSKPAPDYVGEVLSPVQIRAAGLFQPDAVDRLLRKAGSGLCLSETDEMALAGIISAQLVYRQFVSNFRLAEKVSPQNDDVRFCGLHSPPSEQQRASSPAIPFCFRQGI